MKWFPGATNGENKMFTAKNGVVAIVALGLQALTFYGVLYA
jgi:hypothetical protein